MRARASIAVLTAVVACLVAPAAAGAHAVLRHSTPHADETLQRTPDQIVFDFNEPVQAAPGAVRVFDQSGRRVDGGAVSQPRPRSAAVGVQGGLGRGVYTATYRVISADGHPVSGGTAFGVRTAVRAGRSGLTVGELLASQGAGAGVEPLYGIARGLHYAALLLFLGAVPFVLLVWRAGGEQGRWPASLLRGGAATGLLCALGGLVLQGLLTAGRGLTAALSSGTVEVALDTHSGRAWLARVVLWLFVLVLAWTRRAYSREHLAWLTVLLIGLVASLPYAGHASTQHPEAVLVAADVLHVLAAGAWLGGLVLLVSAFWPDRDRRTIGAWAATDAFSRLAFPAVLTIVAAGALQSWFYFGGLAGFIETTYGIALLAKIALVAAVVALAASNRRRLRTRDGRSGSLVRSAMLVEVAAAVAVLAATAVLVRSTPPEAIANGPQEKELDLGPLRAELVVEPATVGPNAIHVYLFDRRTGAQISKVEQLTLTLSQAKAGIAPIELGIPRKGVAHYELLGQPLPAAGDWKTVVTARVSDFDEFAARTTLTVRRP